MAAAASPLKRLRHGFSRLLRRRGRARHFARHPLQDRFAHVGRAEPASPAVTETLLAIAADEPAAALARLKSHPEGLTRREAAARLARHGPNEVEHDRPPGPLRHFAHCARDPFNLLLGGMALIAALTGDRAGALVIGLMVILSTSLRFVQEGRSSRAAEALRALVGNRVTVLRRDAGDDRADAAQSAGNHAAADPGRIVPRRSLEIALQRVVPGDVVSLSAGDMIPADCRVLTARDLFVAQAAITGESAPVEKFADRRDATAQLFEQSNLLFMGTNVVSGTATALVVATGGRTQVGAIAARVAQAETAAGAFQTGVDGVSWLLLRFAAVMVPLVFLLNGWARGQWFEAFLFALSVAVGLTPEMLPMIVTTTLARGAVALARRRVVVKRLDAIHTLGSIDTLCTDKTGTLTQDRLALGRHVDAYGSRCDEVLSLAFLNSHFQTGLRNLLDRAVLARVELPVELQLERDWRLIDEIPFDFERRRMSVVVAERDRSPLLICKGAVEEVLERCASVRAAGASGAAGATDALDAALRARVLAVARELNGEGLRVVAVATREMPAGQGVFSVADERDLVLAGYIAFLDPPKDSAAPALRALAAHGVRVKVLTGDSPAVAEHVCREVGIPVERVLLGAELEAMDDAGLAAAVQGHTVFAKLAPLQKARIVRALQAGGNVVGFLGDGINDAPALRAADVGISVDTAVDIAKESADIVLLDKSLAVLDDGVVTGRTTVANLNKYIRMAASSNFGNVLSVLVASAFLPFLPMLPLHLLVQNLLYDFSQTALPFDRVDPDLTARPLRWNPASLGRFMLCFGPVSSVFDLAAFAVLWFALGASAVEQQSLFQSGWFVVGLLTQVLVVHMLRSPHLPFVGSRPSPALLATTLTVAAVGLWLPMGPLAPWLRLQPLPPAFWPWLAGLLLGYALLASAVKAVYQRRYGWQ
jgi:Mg2+-importing ATPase